MDARCEKRASKTPQIPSGGVALCLRYRPISCAAFSALFNDEIVQRRDDDATQGCFLIECNNAFFQKREVFERTRVLTFLHLFLSLSLSLSRCIALDLIATPRRGRGRRCGNNRRFNHHWGECERNGRFRDDAVDVRGDVGERQRIGNFVRKRGRREP